MSSAILQRVAWARMSALRIGNGLGTSRNTSPSAAHRVLPAFRSSVRHYSDPSAEEIRRKQQQRENTSEVEEVILTRAPAYRFNPWLTALLITGLGFTAYGLGELWGVMTIWPKEVRSDLREGLTADYKGDRTISEQYLNRAWETARSLPTTKFGSNPYLKTTGIAICLAGVYEADGKKEEAYRTYQEALRLLRTNNDPNAGPKSGLTPPETMRAVAIAYKLGELAHILQKPQEEEEKWLAWSVETVLKDVMGAPVATGVLVHTGDDNEMKAMVQELRLPKWVLKHDLAAPFEALGSFYSRIGNISYALPLYLQAVSILMPPSQTTMADDQCRGAQLMGNIAELIVRTSTSPEALVQAESWASKGLEATAAARKTTLIKHPVCEVAYAFMLYNLAVIREMSGDQIKAHQLFTECLDQSKAIGLTEGVKNAEGAILGLGSTATKATSLLPEVQF